MIFVQATRIISIAVIIIGLVVMIGWFTDDDDLKRLNPDWVTMKFSTAASFLVSGMVVFLINESRNKNSEASKIIIFAPLIVVLFFMATLLVSTISGTSTGVSSLFVKEEASAALHSVKAGTPSVGTMINFLLIIGAGFTYLLANPKHRKYLTISGGIILALAIIALIGYAIDSPSLYYQVEGASGAMALHTAIAFALLGIGLILLSKPKYIEREVSKKHRSLKISTKLIFAFLISALFPIIVVGFISFDLAQTSLENETFISINEEADLQVKRIEANFFERKADAVVLSQYHILKQEIPILNQFYQDTANQLFIESQQRVDERLDVVEKAYGYDSIGLLNPEGDIIYATGKGASFIGVSFTEFDPQTIIEGKKGVYISDVIGDTTRDLLPDLFISAPIFDEDDNLLGIVVLDVKIARYLDGLMQQSHIGETGETLVVKKLGEKVISLNALRFSQQMEMSMDEMMKGVAGPAYKATAGLEGTGYDIDYRHHEILAAWRYMPELDLGLVSKIDVAEAFAPIDQLQRDITVLAVVFMTGIGFFGVAASRTIANPLIKLKDLAVKISEGDLDSRVLVQSTDEIGQLSEMMNETAVKLKNTQKEKEEFVAMITHDLKQPLVPILGNVEMLANPKMGELNEMQKECVDEIAVNASRQLSMIDNLVSAQKLGAGAMKYDIEELSSKDILNDCIKTHGPIMNDKKIEYFDSSTEDIKVKADKRRILEAFTNIIQNAHDFVPQDGKIEIGVNDGEKEVTFFVKDNGEGIPKEKQDKLFKKYGQVESKAKRKFGGTGLGLSVSQELVNGMGGKIWLESDVGKGTTFFFTIPRVM